MAFPPVGPTDGARLLLARTMSVGILEIPIWGGSLWPGPGSLLALLLGLWLARGAEPLCQPLAHVSPPKSVCLWGRGGRWGPVPP